MPNGFRRGVKRHVDHYVLFYGRGNRHYCLPRDPITPDKHIVRAPILLSGEFPSFTCVPFLAVVALIPWNMPGREKGVGRFVPFGTGAASYSARKIHFIGLRDFCCR